MKKAKFLVLGTIAVLLLGTGNVKAQEKEPQTVIIRVFEQDRGKESQMVVSSPSGSTKSVELTNVRFSTFEGNESNIVIVQSEINNWKKKGFSIDGLSSLSNYVGAMVTTIILSKDE